MDNQLKNLLNEIDLRVERAVGHVAINNILKRTSAQASDYNEIEDVKSDIKSAINSLEQKLLDLTYIYNNLVFQDYRKYEDGSFDEDSFETGCNDRSDHLPFDTPIPAKEKSTSNNENLFGEGEQDAQSKSITSDEDDFPSF